MQKGRNPTGVTDIWLNFKLLGIIITFCKVEEDESIIMNTQTTGIKADNSFSTECTECITVLYNSSTVFSANSFYYYFLFVCFCKNSEEAIDTPFFLYNAIELHGHWSSLLPVTERAEDISVL